MVLLSMLNGAFLSCTIVVHLSANFFSRIGIIPSSRQWRIRGTTVKISLGLNGVSMSFLTRLKRWVILACRSRRPSGKNFSGFIYTTQSCLKSFFFESFINFISKGPMPNLASTLSQYHPRVSVSRTSWAKPQPQTLKFSPKQRRRLRDCEPIRLGFCWMSRSLILPKLNGGVCGFVCQTLR